ncbi:MAG: hypothetical protein ACLQSR_07850 [Limisphaerales bacterium]
MSFNVENLFIKCSDNSRVAEVIESHWRNSLRPLQPDWGLPSSFEPLLANEPKRKIAISPSREGWVALVESKQVVDFDLAKKLSEQLATTVLVIQLFEISGESGYASAEQGRVLESHFGENDDPLGSVREALKKYKVPFDVILFREAVLKSSEGWSWKQKA